MVTELPHQQRRPQVEALQFPPSLTANSNYTIVTRITRQDSGTTYNTASVSTTTKKYLQIQQVVNKKLK